MTSSLVEWPSCMLSCPPAFVWRSSWVLFFIKLVYPHCLKTSLLDVLPLSHSLTVDPGKEPLKKEEKIRTPQDPNYRSFSLPNWSNVQPLQTRPFWKSFKGVAMAACHAHACHRLPVTLSTLWRSNRMLMSQPETWIVYVILKFHLCLPFQVDKMFSISKVYQALNDANNTPK